MSLYRGFRDIFLAKPFHNLTRPKHILEQKCPYFVCSKIEYLCGYFNQNRNHVGLYMIIIPIHTHYWFIRKVHKSWERYHRQISCPTLPYSTKPTPKLEQNLVVLWLCWPKTQLSRIVHCKNTGKISWLVNHKGAWVLGGESMTCFLSNLDTT